MGYCVKNTSKDADSSISTNHTSLLLPVSQFQVIKQSWLLKAWNIISNPESTELVITSVWFSKPFETQKKHGETDAKIKAFFC